MNSRLIQKDDQVWSLPQFLTPNACQNLILFSEQKGFKEADVGFPSGARMMKNMRNNDRAVFNDPVLVNKLWDSLKPHIPDLNIGAKPVKLYEKIRVYRYGPGQRFKRHIDGRISHEGLESRLTFMIYLNDNFSGGATRFDNVTIQPETGKALLFVHEQQHEGCAVIGCEKYVLRSDILYRPAS